LIPSTPLWSGTSVGYDRVQLLRYLEESLAQGAALPQTRGVGSLPEALRFPFAQGYNLSLWVVGAQATAAAGATVGAYKLGVITIGPMVYNVFVEPSASSPARPASATTPATAPQRRATP
jgi:hypothetical protein